MKNEKNNQATAFEQWRELTQFPRPSSAIRPLRTELPIWNAYIFTCPAKMAPGTQKWGYNPEKPLPEISVSATKNPNPIMCRSQLLLACLLWLERDPHVVKYKQPIETIVINFDGVEYFINVDLWVECKGEEVWMINLIDSKTELLCKEKPLLLESVELFCESINCQYFPVREDDLISFLLMGHTNRIDNLGRLKIDGTFHQDD